MVDHLSDDTLSALLDRQLEPAELRDANAHVESCASCAERLAQLRSVIAMLRGLPDLDPPRDFALGPRLLVDPPNVIRLQRWYTWSRAAAASLAAAFVFLVGGTVYLDSVAPPTRSPSTLLVANESKAVAPTTAPGVAAPAVARDRTSDNPPPAAPAAPQLARQPASVNQAQPAGAAAGAASSAEQPTDQVAAATTVRALPTLPPPTPTPAPIPTAAILPSAASDPAAPLRVGALIAGVLSVLALLLVFIVRHRLLRARPSNLTLE